MIVNPPKDIMDELEAMGVRPCDKISMPIGVIAISHGNKIKIKRKVSISRCFSDELGLYEIKMFDMQMEFFAPLGLTGQDIYNICENIYLTS